MSQHRENDTFNLHPNSPNDVQSKEIKAKNLKQK